MSSLTITCNMIWMMSLGLYSYCVFFNFLVCSEADDSQFSMMRLQDPIEFGGPNRGSEKKINRCHDRSREMEGKEKEPTWDRWRRKERREDEWEKDEKGHPRERWEERQMNRETKGHMRTAWRGGCPAVGDCVKGGRGRLERGGVANVVLSNCATAL